MGVSIGQAKQQFATIVECLHREPPLLSQFAVWLDLKLAEYKLQGGMRLDFHEVVSHPDWMQGVKCRCIQNVASKVQSLSQNGGFGNTAWMFPLMDSAGNSAKQSGYSEELGGQRTESSVSRAQELGTLRQNGRETESIHSNRDIDDLVVQQTVTDKNNSLPDDRNIMNSCSVGYPEKQSDKRDQSGSAASFLSNLAMAVSYDHQKDGAESSGMSLPVRPIGEETALESPVDEQYIGDYLADSGDEDNNSNDRPDDDDEMIEYEDEEEDSLPKIVSVTSVEPESSICYPKGFRSNKRTKSKLRINALSPAKKMRVVRNYSREFKLRVIGHCLKHGTKSAMLTFDVPKTNCQRWTARVAKSSPDCGIPDTTGLESELARAEERLATWVRDTYRDSGPPTILALQSMASTIFKHVHPDFEPAYVWVLNYLARYKLAKVVDLPCDFDDACPVTTEDLSDLC